MATTEPGKPENIAGEGDILSPSLEGALELAIEAASEHAGVEAAQAASAARILLVRKLSDIVVLPAGRISSNQRAVAADVLLQVVGKVEPALRTEIATRVARVQECPPALLRMLLLDEAGVAGPVLEGAEALSEALLLEAARAGTLTHRMLIAGRLDLTACVAEALVEAGEPEVARLLLRREEFTLSPNAIELLVARSVNDVELQGLLLRRRELEPAHGFMMFWWVEPERRRRILARFSVDRATIQDALQDLYPIVFREQNPDPLVKEILVMMDRRHRPRGLNGEPVAMDVVKKTLNVARRNPAAEVVDAIGMIAGVSRELAARILREPSGEPYAVLCKSLGVPRSEFFEFLQYRDSNDEQMTPERAEDLLGIFDSMARDFARAVLRYWDWDGNPRIARITGLLGMDEDVL